MPVLKRLLVGIVVGLFAFGQNAAASDVNQDTYDALLEMSLEELMQVKVTSIASGIVQPLNKAPALATVITAEEIKSSGARVLSEVLETVPGMHVGRDFQFYNPHFIVRGVVSQYNPQVLMLVNGVPTNNLFLGNRGHVWGGMPVNGIARVEVIRGPGSAVYGADAFAAVINVVTKGAADIAGLEAGVRFGTQRTERAASPWGNYRLDTRDAWALYGGKVGGVEVSVTAEAFHSDGVDGTIGQIFGPGASSAPGKVNTGVKGADLRFDAEWDNLHLRAGYQLRRDIGMGVGLAPSVDSRGRYASDRKNVDLSYDLVNLADGLDARAELSFLDVGYYGTTDTLLFPEGAVVGPPGTAPFADGATGNPSDYERHAQARIDVIQQGSGDHQARAGVGFRHSELYRVEETKNFEIGAGLIPLGETIDATDTENVFLNEGTRDNLYLYVQDQWDFAPGCQLTLGERFDYFSDFGHSANTRAALVIDISPSATLKMLYGTAFRAPAFVETRTENNPIDTGNPNLEPETIVTKEIGLDLRPAPAWQLAFNLFEYHWRDAIVFVPSDPPRRAQNIGHQQGWGGEMEFLYKPKSTFWLSGNYSLQHSSDQATYAQVPNVPRHQA